jgi:ABC-type multidrug transport system ATPase subunit
MELLNSLAVKRGMTIVASIHQPRSTIFELFDKLLILQKGETAFFGDASKSIEYFVRAIV